MGRAKPKREEADYTKLKDWVVLRPETQREFARLLNLDEPRFRGEVHRAIIAVQTMLGMYRYLQHSQENAPRPAHRLAEINPLAKSAKDTYHGLSHLSSWVQLDLGWSRGNEKVWLTNEQEPWRAESVYKATERLKRDLPRLIEALSLAGKKLERFDSRHGKRKLATKLTVENLGSIFEQYYRHNPEIKNKLDDKILFIQEALDALNEHLKRDEFKHSKSQIARLLASKN